MMIQNVDRHRAAGSRRLWGALLLGLLPGTAALAQQFVEQTTTRFPSPNPAEWTNQVTFGDIDGDGDLDILFANGGNFSSPGTPQLLRVYINNGSGFFADETMARTGGLTGLHRGVELGDCDLDGDLDVVGAQDFNLLPTLLINNGSGVFTSEAGTRLPALTLASSRGQFGDVDNDGDLDLFFTSGTTSRFTCGQYRLYRNDGTCHYTDITTTHFPLGTVCNNMDAIFGDIDGDFDIDIRTASTGTNNSRMYRNDGSGVYTVDNTVPADDTCYSYDFGDIDGDGDLDLLGANGGPGNTDNLMANDGSGTYTSINANLSPNPNEDDNDSKFFDYDNDGDLDLIIARLGGGEKLYRNTNGLGMFALTTGVFQQVADSSLDVKVGDLTGDGAYDVVTAQGESGNFQNRIYVNNGPADTLPPRVIDTEQVVDATSAGPYIVRAAILDHVTSDRNFFDEGITLNYSVNAGPDQAVPMRHSGGQIYRGAIPGQPSGSTVEYWVTARDFNLNLGIGSTLSFLIPDCSGVSDCSGHGTCVANGVCDCEIGWGGPDCSQFSPFPGGAVPDGTVDPDTPLTLRKGPGGIVRMSWDDSCGPADEDYAVYQGTVGGTFTSHVPLVCTTGSLKMIQFVPGPGDLYFLVVPTTLNAEGSYGLDGNLAERPPSSTPCLPQAVASCP
jgi:hypothetical protein